MYGGRDIVVSPHQWEDLLAGISSARIERFPHSGHFIMLDEPEAFRTTLKGFLDADIDSP